MQELPAITNYPNPRGSGEKKNSVDGFKVLNSEDLFSGAREIVIAHEDVCYRLRITKAGKLILNK